jgi:sulfate adenylyltransferase (ADP) / ATP adenylyltransferase
MTSLTLIEAIDVAIRRASASGALLPVELEESLVCEGGIEFRLCWVSSLSLKNLASLPKPGDKATGANPFLPYEPDLFVADLDTHVALLNKFPSLQRHIILATRVYAEQLAPLNKQDFTALAAVMQQMEGLAFFNGGNVAGASQRHKHIQFVQLDEIPLEAVLPQHEPLLQPRRLPELPFGHVFVALDTAHWGDASRAATQLTDAFAMAAQACGLAAVDGVMSPYNLLISQRWLLLIPRSREAWEQHGHRISLNALCFAGIVLVARPESLEVVKSAGLRNLLSAVTP